MCWYFQEYCDRLGEWYQNVWRKNRNKICKDQIKEGGKTVVNKKVNRLLRAENYSEDCFRFCKPSENLDVQRSVFARYWRRVRGTYSQGLELRPSSSKLQILWPADENSINQNGWGPKRILQAKKQTWIDNFTEDQSVDIDVGKIRLQRGSKFWEEAYF